METLNTLLFTTENYKPYFTFWRHNATEPRHFIYRQQATPGEPTGFSRFTFPIVPETAALIDAYTRQQQPGRFALLFAAFTFLLHKYSGREDVIIHTPLYKPLEPGTVYEPVVPLRMTAGGQTLAAYIEMCKQGLKAHYQFQNFPLQLTVSADYETDLYHSNILLRYEGLHYRFNTADMATRYDMVIDIRPQAPGLSCTIHYNTAAFEAWWVHYIEKHVHSFLSYLSAPDTPLSDISILSREEADMLARFNDTGMSFPHEATMHMLFQQQAARTPDQPAVIYNEKRLTYRQLNETANQLAYFLIAHYHIQPGDILGICLPRSEWQVICMLGVLKTGAVYLPIDHTLPEERTRFILRNAGASLLITDETPGSPGSGTTGTVKLGEQLLREIAAFPTENPAGKAQAESPAYIIYTSGSTGAPKGVVIAHRSNVNMSLDQIRRFDIRPEDRVLQFSSVSFDASISEYFMALYCGATLVVVDEGILWDTGQFLSHIKQQGVTVVTLPPSYVSILPPGQLGFLRVLITAGEAAHPAHARSFSQMLNYYNAYGPTEYAVCATIYKARKETGLRVPIGSPIANTQLYVLDSNRQPLPLGVTGNLYISGEGLAIGYLGLDELTREKFVPHWRDPGKKMYNTGDLARWMPDGNLEFMGRSDDQVKINGFRIEPGEIMHTLLQFPGIAECVVLPVEKNNEWRLAAFYRRTEPADAAMSRQYEQSILEYLRSKLSHNMIPSFLIAVERFPTNTNGKIDKSKLLPLLQPEETHIAPRNAAEEKMKHLWETILGVKPIGVRDNFFKLGGSSIDIIALYNSISVEYPHADVRAIFKYPTIELFTEAVTRS